MSQKRLRIELSPKLHSRVVKAAEKKGQTIKKWLNDCVYYQLENEKQHEELIKYEQKVIQDKIKALDKGIIGNMKSKFSFWLL